MPRTIAALSVLLVCTITAAAETKTFRNEGLRNETMVKLDIQGSKVGGTFVSSEYGEEPAVEHRFSGEIVRTPKGKVGVYIHIRFDGDVPYSVPPNMKTLEWYLKIVDHRAHLFIPMQERSYAGKTPKWIISDVDLVPE